jgi:hypothetical protein
MLIQKHRVYEGVLREVGEGTTIVGTGGGKQTTIILGPYGGTIRERDIPPSDYMDQIGWIQRSYMDVGDTRIRNVVVLPVHDEMLREAVGQEVALSILGPGPESHKRNSVIATRTPRVGVFRPPRKVILWNSIKQTLKYWLVSPILAFIIVMVGAALGKFVYEPLFYLGLAAAAVAFVTWILLPIFGAARVFKAAGALKQSHSDEMRSQLQA